ncbi:MAG: hypothetical protein ABJA74_06140 [Lapillicoccus sp.]
MSQQHHLGVRRRGRQTGESSPPRPARYQAAQARTPHGTTRTRWDGPDWRTHEHETAPHRRGLAATIALLAAGPAGAASLSDAPARDTITGTPGNDDLVGTHGPDVIRALAGDDSVRGLAGADRIRGATGADVLYGFRGADYISAGPGADV